MADATAIVQVAAPSAVALAAIWFSSRQQVRGFRHDQRITDRAELRERLDAATGALTSLRGVTGAIESDLLLGQSVATGTSTLAEELRKHGRAVELDQDRLSIRLGAEKRLVQAHRAARDAGRDVGNAIAGLSGLAARDVSDAWAAVRQSNAEIESARELFVREAVELIGVEPERPRRVPLLRVRLVRRPP